MNCYPTKSILLADDMARHSIYCLSVYSFFLWRHLDKFGLEIASRRKKHTFENVIEKKLEILKTSNSFIKKKKDFNLLLLLLSYYELDLVEKFYLLIIVKDESNV